MKREKILIVDDDPDIIYAIRLTFEKNGYALADASTGKQGIEVFAREKPDVVFLDITMPDISGLEVMKKFREESDVPVIMMTGYGTMDTAIKAVQLGAYEYITKPLDADRLRLLVRRALETTQLKREIAGLRLARDTTFQPYTLIGNSAAMQNVYKTIGAVTTTPNSTTVLIRGESGTGKELTARVIHNSGQNTSEPFIVVNCTVLPENLLESELFGHEKGAFTGAVERKIGKLELAGKGTILFDEISELTPKLQAKLLRLLQEREFERLGGNEVIKVTARFIVATNRNLEEAVKQGQFREDLFFRINVVVIHLPPLRERKEDLPLLMDHFAAKNNAKLGKNIKAIEPQVMKNLIVYHFPGNVRELENIMERAMIINKGDVLTADALGEFPTSVDTSSPTIELPITTFDLRKARQEIFELFEKQFLEKLLAETGGNITEAARLANIERQSLHRMLKRHNLTAEKFHTK
ncbi:MAG: sigma-54-dependent Fis family transcriptional regulator [Ignavibacteriae bacterium]|nr:sigma-54-dependent Fis family transcriptional regulator [Ignavibacteriota bacterium]